MGHKKRKNMTDKIILKDFLNGIIPTDEIKLAEISDRIWELGTLEEIREKVSPDLFIFHICVNMIGNWQGDGWHGIISNQPELVPYIPLALKTLGLQKLKTVFQNMILVFPEFVVFKEDKTYCDVINFLQNESFKISDERLLEYSREERIQMGEKYHEYLDELEKLTSPLWGCMADRDGWGAVLDYVYQKM